MTDPLQPGDPLTLGAYRLAGRLGQGGMGTVYLGQDANGRQVAVKVINSALAANPHFRDRFRREVEAARKVRPFCTAPVLDASLEGDQLYVVTEYIPGPTLQEAVANTGPLQGSDLAGLAVGVATALAAIHDTGIIHRDLKPSNVLLSGVGPRVIDFGVSKASDLSELTQFGQVLGTPAYRAPELASGAPASPASDVFSWACVVVFAASGRPPFEEADATGSAPPDLPGVDPDLRGLVHQALSHDPADRPSVSELLQRLTGHSHVPDSTTSPPSTPPQPSPDSGNSAPWLVSIRAAAPSGKHLGIAAAALTMLALVLWLALPDRSSSGSLPQPKPSRSTPSQVSGTPSPTHSTSPNTSPVQPADTGDIDPRFIGRWTGVITDHGANPLDFSAVITINPGRLSEVVGESDYSSMPCQGTLTLVSASKTRLVVEERITKGFCKERVLITLTYRNPQALHYEYKLVTIVGNGVLRPT